MALRLIGATPVAFPEAGFVADDDAEAVEGSVSDTVELPGNGEFPPEPSPGSARLL